MAEYGPRSRKCRWCGASGGSWDCGGPKCVPLPMRDAIMRFKHDNGTYWRDKLRKAWESGIYDGVDEGDEHLLQSARNRFGSRCLGGPNNVPKGGE